MRMLLAVELIWHGSYGEQSNTSVVIHGIVAVPLPGGVVASIWFIGA